MPVMDKLKIWIKKDNLRYWKNELGDLCGLCIKPMLELAETDFETSCEVGLKRRSEKMGSLKP